MERITKKQLEFVTAKINSATSSPPDRFTDRNTNNHINLVTNKGHYYIQGAYGGYQLQRIVNRGGGAQDITRGGFIPKRDLYYQLWAFYDGIQAGVNWKQEKS